MKASKILLIFALICFMYRQIIGHQSSFIPLLMLFLSHAISFMINVKIRTCSLAFFILSSVIIVILTGLGKDSLMEIGLILIIVVIAHYIIGYVSGYSVYRIAGLDKSSSRTVAFGV